MNLFEIKEKLFCASKV